MLTKVKLESPLILYIKKTKRPVLLDDIMRDIEDSDISKPNPTIDELKAVKEELEKLEVALCIPIFFEEKLVGLFNFGSKISQDGYSNDEISLISTLSGQLAIAIENAILQENMLKAQRQLLMADKLSSLGRIAAGMAHEIKNPLAAIKGMTQAIEQNDGDSETLKDFKEVVPKEVDRLNNLVEKLVRYGRPPKLQTLLVDINTLIEDSLKLFENQFKQKNISLTKNFNLKATATIDPEQITQVITNLILNAIQAMPTGGTIRIETDETTDKAIIKISDTGIGIAQDKIKYIFDPFFSTKENGMGLGLAITYKIIKDHKGDIEAQSIEGEGTTFTVLLPKNHA